MKTALALLAIAGCFPLDLACSAGGRTVQVVPLPSLQIQGQPARAHTQGLELVGEKIFVTARQDDVSPRRALLLRTEAAGKGWDVWDITPPRRAGTDRELDHPGGMQSDGRRLWIPLAESRRGGRSVVRVFALNHLKVGAHLEAEFEFAVSDHIGALAVSTEHRLVLGASWDTETVYVWDLQGRLQRKLTGVELEARGLGVSQERSRKPGVAVQDWKFTGARLIASGLSRAPASERPTPQSRLLAFQRFLESDFQKRTVELPVEPGPELAREGMAVSESWTCFLAEDLGATNRMFRVRTLAPGVN